MVPQGRETVSLQGIGTGEVGPPVSSTQNGPGLLGLACPICPSQHRLRTRPRGPPPSYTSHLAVQHKQLDALFGGTAAHHRENKMW